MRYSDNPFKHARTARHDVTGRHSPLHIPREQEPAWLPFIGGLVIGVLALYGLVWWITT